MSQQLINTINDLKAKVERVSSENKLLLEQINGFKAALVALEKQTKGSLVALERRIDAVEPTEKPVIKQVKLGKD